jgi:hypothetical protein
MVHMLFVARPMRISASDIEQRAHQKPDSSRMRATSSLVHVSAAPCWRFGRKKL